MSRLSEDAGAGGGEIALCGGCQPLGRCRFGITRLTMGGDGVALAAVRCDPSNQGGPMVAHGGWTAAVFDDLLGRIPGFLGILAVTATLRVDFLKPVPIERDLVARAWMERREGRRLHLAGALHLAAGMAELARAEGVWIERRPDHFDRHRRWLKDQAG